MRFYVFLRCLKVVSCCRRSGFKKASTTKFLHENRNFNRKIQHKKQDVENSFCVKEKCFNVSVYGMPVGILFG